MLVTPQPQQVCTFGAHQLAQHCTNQLLSGHPEYAAAPCGVWQALRIPAEPHQVLQPIQCCTKQPTRHLYGECLLHVSTFATTRVALPTGVEPG
jgi:hypothetical protein